VAGEHLHRVVGRLGIRATTVMLFIGCSDPPSSAVISIEQNKTKPNLWPLSLDHGPGYRTFQAKMKACNLAKKPTLAGVERRSQKKKKLTSASHKSVQPGSSDSLRD